jgi:histidine ammonia-lyase
MDESRRVVEAALSDGLSHYGINTGFGSLSRQRIGQTDLRTLQRNLIRSHAAGVGEPLPAEVVRAMMTLLAASLCRGRSGTRPLLAESIVAMLNADIVPIVPSLGSVGASGDLAPLAHVALCLLGEGDVMTPSGTTTAAAALQRTGLCPVTLEAKEGLALINGTHLMAAQAALACADAQVLFDWALDAGAMSIDGCRATDSFLDERIHAARTQPGQQQVAAKLRDALRGSEIVTSHLENDPRVQDPYCLRCMPQVLGASLDCLTYVRTAVERELGAVTDNPLVFSQPDAAIVSGGNFHGMPLAIPLDAMTIALTHVAGISERRTFWMTAAFDSESHLKPYLASGQPGLSSGLMIAQYAAAACCNELITLCAPASVANIGTSAGMEDYNSFGPRAAAKARRAIDLARSVVAIELLTAAAAIDVHRPLRSGDRIELVHRAVRGVVAALTEDRPPAPDIRAIEQLMLSPLH